MFNVIVDTREQQPWTFSKSESIDKLIRTKLDTGDYSIEGMESLLCIERKKSVSELASNITTTRFKDELLRMEQFRYKFLILEFDFFDIDKFPDGSNIPKYMRDKIKVSGNFIMRYLSEIQIKYNIHIIPCSNTQYAEYVATNIMKRVYEYNK